MGVVTGPFSATLLARMESSTSRGSGSPKRARASEPTKNFSHSTSTPEHSMIDTTEAVTSGPMPSPGSRVILCLAIGIHPFNAGAGFAGRELHGQQLGQGAVLRELAQASPHALDGGRNELQIVQPPAGDGLFGERAEDLEGALQKGLEVAPQRRPPFDVAEGTAAGHAHGTPLGVVVDELQLHLLAQDAGHAPTPEQVGQTVRVRPHSHVLIVNDV